VGWAAGEIRRRLRCELPRVARVVLLKTAQRAPRAKVSRTKAPRINARRGGQSTLANDIRRRVPAEGYLRAIRFRRATSLALEGEGRDCRCSRAISESDEDPRSRRRQTLRCRVPPGPPRSFSDRDARVGGIAREEEPRGMRTGLRVRLGLRKRARERETDD